MIYTPVVIANAASLSDAIIIRPDTSNVPALVGIAMPATWTAANLTFQVSDDFGATFNNLYDKDGIEVTVVASASRYIILVPGSFAGINYLKVRSGTAGTPVAQGGARTIRLISIDAR